MNLQDQGLRFYVHEDGSSRWMHPELAERQNKDGGWHDMTDASDDALGYALARHNPPMRKTTREKQEDFRARMALLGMKEVRGIYLPETLHPVIKEQAAKLLEQHQKEQR